MQTHRIAAGPLAADLMPELGGRIVSLRLDDGAGPALDVFVPLVGAPVLPPRWPKAGAYPLAPYSNRIRNAKLTFRGHVHELPPHPDALPHTVHGHAHRMPWRLAEHSASSATLAYDHDGTGEWPWRFAVEQHIGLAGTRLSVAFTFTNRDARPAPAGFGWHPYFPIKGDPSIGFSAGTLWAQSADNVATGTVVRRTPADAPVVLDARGDTLYFGEWDGRCAFSTGTGLTVRLKADPVLSHLVLHRPAGIDYVCIEPVSHVADGFNLAAGGIAGTGTRSLDPGESLSGGVTMDLARSG
ncbi:MAG: aldose 1-epimerase [Alphaproteobacteria bacterium]|nr:aldose 1-epimerase [Alphaproteobacteria bacterium]